jgi:hypothetical protein
VVRLVDHLDSLQFTQKHFRSIIYPEKGFINVINPFWVYYNFLNPLRDCHTLHFHEPLRFCQDNKPFADLLCFHKRTKGLLSLQECKGF